MEQAKEPEPEISKSKPNLEATNALIHHLKRNPARIRIAPLTAVGLNGPSLGIAISHVEQVKRSEPGTATRRKQKMAALEIRSAPRSMHLLESPSN